MLHYYSLSSHKIEAHKPGKEIGLDTIWIDLFNPEIDEIKLVENLFHLKLPSKEEMQEIEASSRLFQENELAYMTINMLISAESEHPFLSPVTFILHEK